MLSSSIFDYCLRAFGLEVQGFRNIFLVGLRGLCNQCNQGWVESVCFRAVCGWNGRNGFGCKGLKLHGFKTLGLLGFGPTHEKALGLRFLGPAFCRAQGCDKYYG